MRRRRDWGGGPCQLCQIPGEAAAAIRPSAEGDPALGGRGLGSGSAGPLFPVGLPSSKCKRRMPTSKLSSAPCRGHLPNHGGRPRTDNMCACRNRHLRPH